MNTNEAQVAGKIGKYPVNPNVPIILTTMFKPGLLGKRRAGPALLRPDPVANGPPKNIRPKADTQPVFVIMPKSGQFWDSFCSTPLAIALSVSNTPSPLTATAS